MQKEQGREEEVIERTRSQRSGALQVTVNKLFTVSDGKTLEGLEQINDMI